MDINQVTLIGNVGKDPEIKTFSNGGEIANFSMATTSKWKNKAGEPVESTQWHRVVVKNKHLIKVVNDWVQKGTRLYVQGQVEQRSYEKDGAQVYITEIVVPAFGGTISIEARGKGSSEEGGQRTERKPKAKPQDDGGFGDGSSDGFDLDDNVPF